MFNVHPGKPPGLLPEYGIVLHGDIDGRIGRLQAGVEDLYRTGLVVYRVVYAFLQLPSPRGDAHRTSGHVKGPNGYPARTF